MFSRRQMEIISSLTKTKELVTAEWIAKKLGISDRTVRNEIKLIQPECTKLGIIIESIRGKGYQLQLLDQTALPPEFIKMMNKTKSEKENFSDQNARVTYLLKQLLLETEPIKLESFEDEMFVSKSTIQNDMKLVRQILLKYNLELVNRPYYGTYVEGDEFMKRLCVANYIFTHESTGQPEYENLELLDQQLINQIRDIIVDKVHKFNIIITDISLENLITHISIACKRIEDGCIIKHINDQFLEEYPFEKMVAKEIVQEVEAYTNLVFPDSEIEYIIVHLSATKLLQQEELTEFSELDEVGTIVQCMLNRLRIELNWDFQHDVEFIQALTLHIRPVMNRLRYRMNIRNPLLDEIKTKYPSAFEGAVIASKCIEEYLAIEPGEHEIAYIALHIAVALEQVKKKQKKIKRVILVCASGVGSAKLLYYRLQNLFENDLEIVASIHSYMLEQYDLTDIDLIVSTIPIKGDFRVPTLVVNTFLGDEDVDQLKRYLYSANQVKLSAYLDPSRVFIHQEWEDKESVIHFLCHELYKQGLVPEDYEHLVLERETLAPTSFGNLVAIPHPITPVTEETFWTVCTLKNPIPWFEHRMVQFVCLLNIQKGPMGNIDDMYKKLIHVVDNKISVQRIIKSKSVDEVIRILHENE